jgi:hypothetical protein
VADEVKARGVPGSTHTLRRQSGAGCLGAI